MCLCVCVHVRVHEFPRAEGATVLEGIPEEETGAGRRKPVAVGGQCRWLMWLESGVCGDMTGDVPRELGRSQDGRGLGPARARLRGLLGVGFQVGE